MPLQFVFWILYLIALIFGFWPTGEAVSRVRLGGNLMLFVLIGVLGWQVFGPVVHR